jgi:hypothetical protein
MEPYEDPSWWDRVRFFVRDRLRSGILRLRSGWLQILQTGVQLLHKALIRIQGFQLRFAFYLQITEKKEWTRRDSNS